MLTTTDNLVTTLAGGTPGHVNAAYYLVERLNRACPLYRFCIVPSAAGSTPASFNDRNQYARSYDLHVEARPHVPAASRAETFDEIHARM